MFGGNVFEIGLLCVHKECLQWDYIASGRLCTALVQMEAETERMRNWDCIVRVRLP